MSSGGGKLKKMAHVGPNMTPMVDVVMCILIFFMLGSTFLTPELFLQSNMPAIDKQGLGTEQTSQTLPPVRVNIKIRWQADQMDPTKGDTWVVMGDSQSMKMSRPDDTDRTDNQAISDYFVQKNLTMSPDVQIIIQPDRHVPFQNVIYVYDYCVKAKFKQVALRRRREGSLRSRI